jgi:hypothetical protein
MDDVYLYISVVVLAVAYLFAYLVQPDPGAFDGWMNVLTHVAAVPAILTESKLAMQVVLTTSVSVIYHIVEALAKDSDFYLPMMQFDVGMSVALIAHVLFIYMDAIPWAPITFLATAAAAFPDYNVGITGAIILFGYPVSTILTLNKPWTTYTLHPIWHVASLLSIYYMILLHQHKEPPIILRDIPISNQLRY